jgi:hypothetical protein
MSTLIDLGLTSSGSYVDGDLNGIVLTLKGAEKFNLSYPTTNDVPNFSAGNKVDINCKKPEQKNSETLVIAIIRGNNGSVSSRVSIGQDDWFERKIVDKVAPKVK